MRRFQTILAVGKFLALLIVIVVVQGILAYRFKVVSYFDLPLIYSVYYGFTVSKPTASVVIGTILGLMQDSLSGAPMGMNGFSKALIGFLAASAGTKFNVDQLVTRVFALFLFTLGDGLLVTMLGLSMGVGSGPAQSDRFASILISAVSNSLLGLVMFGYRDRFRNATA
jgi:rod shape-determining protein MreD